VEVVVVVAVVVVGAVIVVLGAVAVVGLVVVVGVVVEFVVVPVVVAAGTPFAAAARAVSMPRPAISTPSTRSRAVRRIARVLPSPCSFAPADPAGRPDPLL
jgi:hypothetical protein